jgi:hypothetical protein
VPSGFTATRPNAQSWEWTIRQNSGPDWYDLRNWNLVDTRAGGTRVNNDNRTWVTEKWTGALNATWNVPYLQRFPTRMKFGAKWDEETRNNRTDSDLDIWSYIGPGGNTVGVNPTTGAVINTSYGNWANVGPQFVSPFLFDMGTTNSMTVYNINGVKGMPPRVSRTEVANLFHSRPDLFVNTATPENFYTDMYVNARHFRQTMNAGYWQADTRLASRLMIRFGVRAEQTKNAFREFDPLTRAQLLAKGVALNAPATNAGRPLTVAGMRSMFETNPQITRKSDYTDWFPSMVVKYNFTPNLEWQAGVNKGISRPGIDSLTVRLNDKVRIRVGNLTMTNHPIHLHGHEFQVTGTDGGPVPHSARWNEVTTDVAVGQMRQLEFTADEEGDWAFHCHKSHHTMNAMGHNVPTMIGVDHRDVVSKISKLIPDYMVMGERGMADMGEMEMPLPDNTVPMMTGQGPFGGVEMGGMFSVLKVRKGQAPGDYSNPPWYRHPSGSVAYEWTGSLPAATSAHAPGQGSMSGAGVPTEGIEVQIRKPVSGHSQH